MLCSIAILVSDIGLQLPDPAVQQVLYEGQALEYQQVGVIVKGVVDDGLQEGLHPPLDVSHVFSQCQPKANKGNKIT
jgi:hypothetical protein